VAAALTLGLVCCRVGSVMANLRGGTGSPHPPVTPGVSGGHPRAREKDLTTLERVAGTLALPQPPRQDNPRRRGTPATPPDFVPGEFECYQRAHGGITGPRVRQG